jgi:hypothetical protein
LSGGPRPARPVSNKLWMASPASPTSGRLTASRSRVDRPMLAIPGPSFLSLLPVSGRAGARASTCEVAWRSRAFGGGALRRRPTGRIKPRRR